MANGQLAAGAITGGTAGAVAGPFGAAIGGIAGYAAADFGNIFGKKKAPVSVPWYKQPGVIELVAVGAGILLLVFLIKRK